MFFCFELIFFSFYIFLYIYIKNNFLKKYIIFKIFLNKKYFKTLSVERERERVSNNLDRKRDPLIFNFLFSFLITKNLFVTQLYINLD